MYRIGLVGTGYIARAFHIPAIKSIEGCELLAICDKNLQRLNEVGEEHQVSRKYLSYEKMLEDCNIDAIVIATPTHCHAQQAINALKHGKHVLVEKPFAVKYDDALLMLEEAKRNDKQIMCAQHTRFREESFCVRKFIKSGKLGSIYYINASCVLVDGIPHAKHYYSDRSLGGGPLYDLGSHLIDLIWWFLDQRRVVSVKAKKWDKLVKSSSLSKYGDEVRNSFDSEVFAHVEIEYEGDILVALDVSFDSLQKENRYECHIYGTEASISWPSCVVYKRSRDDTITDTLTWDKGIYASERQVRVFLDHIRGGSDYFIDPSVSAMVVNIIEKAHESAEQNKTVYF